MIEQVAAARLNIVALPSVQPGAHGPRDATRPRGVRPHQRTVAAGPVIEEHLRGVGQRADPFNPFSAGSIPSAKRPLCRPHRPPDRRERESFACLKMVTHQAAHTLGLADYGLHTGAPADLVVLDAFHPLNTVTAPPAPPGNLQKRADNHPHTSRTRMDLVLGCHTCQVRRERK